MLLGKKIKNWGKSFKNNCERVPFLVKLLAVGLQIYEKLTHPQIFYNGFAKIRSILLSLISKNLITTTFKERLSVDASESCKSWTVLWYIGVFWSSKTSYEFQEHLFFRIPFTFHSLFFVIPGVNKSCIKSCRFKCMYMSFCYHQVLKGYLHQCWKCIYISWL